MINYYVSGKSMILECVGELEKEELADKTNRELIKEKGPENYTKSDAWGNYEDYVDKQFENFRNNEILSGKLYYTMDKFGINEVHVVYRNIITEVWFLESAVTLGVLCASCFNKPNIKVTLHIESMIMASGIYGLLLKENVDWINISCAFPFTIKGDKSEIKVDELAINSHDLSYETNGSTLTKIGGIENNDFI